MPEIPCKLVVRIERGDKKDVVEREYNGNDTDIFYILHDAGLLDEEIKDFLVN